MLRFRIGESALKFPAGESGLRKIFFREAVGGGEKIAVKTVR